MIFTRSPVAFVAQAMILSIATLVIFPAAVAADEEPLLRQFQEQLNHDWFTLGALLQFVGTADLHEDGARGFEIANLRVKMRGKFDAGYSYLIQVNLHKATTLLDARMSYQLAHRVFLDMGAFKAPFSAEALTSASSIDFVNRSVVVSMLAPGRQIGVGVRGAAGNAFHYAAGVFNGNGVTANGNDDNEFLFVARAGARQDHGSVRIDAGVNASHETMETGAGLGSVESEQIFGADARAEGERVFVSGEYILRMRELEDSSADPEAHGFHATGGFRPTERTQLLVRFEGFTANRDDIDMAYFVTGGFNFWPTSVTEFQVNVVVPTEGDIEDGRLLVNAQVAF